MRLFKGISICAGMVFMLGLVACGSVDHDPPKLKSSFGMISPMDTLVVEFDKSLDDFDEDQVTSNVPFTVVSQKGSKVKIVGASDTIADFPRFEPSSDYDTITFTGVRDEDGNKAKAQKLTFSTYPWIDGDEYEGEDCKSNTRPKDAEALADSNEFFNGAKLSRGVTVAGILAGQFNPNCEDGVDSYRLYLKKYDSVSVKLEWISQNVPLQLVVRGPSKIKNAPDFCNVDNEEFVTAEAQKKKSTSIDTTFAVGDIHECGSATTTDNLAYYIQVRYSENLSTKEQLQQPYKLSVTVFKK